ncbi:hypothetical protein BA746_27860 [Vibrio parahaemolyticus]|nr:hypothetical protein D035_4214 [Vibrio parahaemolyticus VP250]EQL99833.1 hypothetical protein D040_0252 [Vibrio parahaemolyticus NIHCB0603]EQM45770.1 hypothetical protein D025_0812 [Vibrio parahaemolyticus 949]OTW27900.1 hypothetical protein BA746_27860 [Vibrio parahaemolyticus]
MLLGALNAESPESERIEEAAPRLDSDVSGSGWEASSFESRRVLTRREATSFCNFDSSFSSNDIRLAAFKPINMAKKAVISASVVNNPFLPILGRLSHTIDDS